MTSSRRAEPPFTLSELIKEVKLCVGPELQKSLDSIHEKLVHVNRPGAINEAEAAKQLKDLVGGAILQQAGLSVMNLKKGHLPHGWISYKDEASKRPFYYNVHTKETTWFDPSKPTPLSRRAHSGDAPSLRAEPSALNINVAQKGHHVDAPWNHMIPPPPPGAPGGESSAEFEDAAPFPDTMGRNSAAMHGDL